MSNFHVFTGWIWIWKMTVYSRSEMWTGGVFGVNVSLTTSRGNLEDRIPTVSLVQHHLNFMQSLETPQQSYFKALAQRTESGCTILEWLHIFHRFKDTFIAELALCVVHLYSIVECLSLIVAHFSIVTFPIMMLSHYWSKETHHLADPFIPTMSQQLEHLHQISPGTHHMMFGLK